MILSATERSRLLLEHKKERDSRICDRIKALLWYDEAMLIDKISKLLFLSPKTIKGHIQEYKEEKKLKPSNGGSKSKLPYEENKELSKHLEDQTYVNVKEISDYVAKTYGIKYSNSGMTNWLHENGFSYKKPVGIPAKANEELQKEFVKKYEEIEKNLKKEEEIVFSS